MIYLLDTNTCIEHLNNRPSVVTQKLRNVPRAQVVLCSIVKAELWHGAYKSARRDSNLKLLERFFAEFSSLVFDDRAAEIYGRLRSHLEQSGTPIGPNDLLIASIALGNDATLVTRNVREFNRIEGLLIENWESST
jgi:tRNA(fMet)-specific endonuclease VapC